MDHRSKGVDGSRVERVLELTGLIVNKNTVPGDRSAMFPSGIRMGTPALTTRGLDNDDFATVAGFFAKGVEVRTGGMNARMLMTMAAMPSSSSRPMRRPPLTDSLTRPSRT